MSPEIREPVTDEIDPKDQKPAETSHENQPLELTPLIAPTRNAISRATFPYATIPGSDIDGFIKTVGRQNGVHTTTYTSNGGDMFGDSSRWEY